jgi:hypothetical protein
MFLNKNPDILFEGFKGVRHRFYVHVTALHRNKFLYNKTN